MPADSQKWHLPSLASDPSGDLNPRTGRRRYSPAPAARRSCGDFFFGTRDGINVSTERRERQRERDGLMGPQ